MGNLPFPFDAPLLLQDFPSEAGAAEPSVEDTGSDMFVQRCVWISGWTYSPWHKLPQKIGNWWLHMVVGGWHEMPRIHVTYRAVGTKCHETKPKAVSSRILDCHENDTNCHKNMPHEGCSCAMWQLSSDMKCHIFMSHDHSTETVSLHKSLWKLGRLNGQNTPCRHIPSKRAQYTYWFYFCCWNIDPMPMKCQNAQLGSSSNCFRGCFLTLSRLTRHHQNPETPCPDLAGQS